MKFAFLFVSAPLLICTSAFAGSAANLIPNGNFATSLDGWTCSGTCNWIEQGSQDDGTGAVDIPRLGASILTSSCFPIQPQTAYDVSFDAWANIGLVSAEFLMTCRAYAGTDCDQPTGNFSYVPLYYFGSGWQGVEGQHDTAAGEHSAMCEVNFSSNVGETRMDSFVFTFNHRLDGIYADGFEGSE